MLGSNPESAQPCQPPQAPITSTSSWALSRLPKVDTGSSYSSVTTEATLPAAA